MPTKTKSTAPKSLAAVLAAQRKKDATLAIGADQIFDVKVEALTTGNIALDAITGVGGLPRGRVTELYGPPASGKTTTALQAAARHQEAVREGRATGAIIYFDHEKALDKKYCLSLGLDVEDEDTFILVQPRSFEQGANLFRTIMRESPGALALAIWDSVAVMVTEHELEADTGAVQVGDRAKMMAQFLRQIIDEINRQNIACVFLNHLQEVIDTSPVGRKLKAQGITRKKTPGGEALKYHASMRVEYKQIGNLRSQVYDPMSNEMVDEVEQTKVIVTVVKNKVAKPFRQAEVRVRFGLGFSQAFSVIEILQAHKCFGSKQGWFKISESQTPPGAEPQMVHGLENLIVMVERDHDWLNTLTNQALAFIEVHGAAEADPEEWKFEDTEGIGDEAIAEAGLADEEDGDE